MGDIVTKVNNNVVKNPDDLVRIIMSSDSNIVLELEGADKTKRLITVQIWICLTIIFYSLFYYINPNKIQENYEEIN